MNYERLGRMVQINKQEAVVDKEALEKALNISIPDKQWTREEGITLFNESAEKCGLSPLKDPKGYMYLDNNLQNYIKDAYEYKYEQAYEDIEEGVGYGTTYAVGAILDNIDGHVRKDIRKALSEAEGEKMLYGDLRFMEATPELVEKVDAMVDARLALTITHSISRSFSEGAKERALESFENSQKALGQAIKDDWHAVNLSQSLDELAKIYGEEWSPWA